MISIKYKRYSVTPKACLLLLLLSAVHCLPSTALAAQVFIEDMTSPEIRARIDAGAKTILIPTGGTEQNGPHMTLAKHNKIVSYTAQKIAEKLGDALVAPVIAYVPEGRITPPEGHMNFAGTISVNERTFAALLEDTAYSFKQHGFTLICFIGDSGGNQAVQKNVAARLTKTWKDSGVEVRHISDYYNKNGQDAWVQSRYPALIKPEAHAGFEDTSELMAVDKTQVREKLRGHYGENDYNKLCAAGDSTLANAKDGSVLLNLKIDAAIQQIKSHALTD